MIKKSFILILLFKVILLCNGIDSLNTKPNQTITNVGIYLSDIDDVNLEEQTFYAEFSIPV